MLAVELLLFEWTPRSFIPVAVAAILAEVERTVLHLPGCFRSKAAWRFHLSALPVESRPAWPGLLSGLLTQMVYACEDAFQKLPMSAVWWSE